MLRLSHIRVMKNRSSSSSHEPSARPRFSIVRTEDGTVIAFDPTSGLSVSSLTVEEALAELARLIAARPAARVAEREPA
jgi:hypothetical protein